MGLEVIVVIAVLLAAVTVVAPLFLHNNPAKREYITHERILNIKKAIVGDSQKVVDRERASFGFVGDLGVLPTDLMELFVRAAPRPTYSLNNNVWYGWRGPYLKPAMNDNGDYSALLDGWGNLVRYSGSGWDREIRSAGEDWGFRYCG